ncbi:MAG: hypothetical protein IPG23_23050 [Burkholderiales bacterium]|jgi:hypothetical protein|nr:hypothetical protein [Burkholderiales bacterium]
MKSHSNRLPLLAFVVGLVGLAGCAAVNDTASSTPSTRVPAFAIVDEQLVQGEMALYADHTGTINLKLNMNGRGEGTQVAKLAGKPILSSCVGRLRHTATHVGSIDLRCNDGALADVRMVLIGDTRGYGHGYTAAGLASVVFGLTPMEARAHLTTPPNKQLLVRSDPARLELK